jgi:hypothetical protein
VAVGSDELDVDRMIQVDLERKAQAEGYVMVPDSFTIRYVQPADAVDPTDPDVIFAQQRDLAIVFASLRCYAAEGDA